MSSGRKLGRSERVGVTDPSPTCVLKDGTVGIMSLLCHGVLRKGSTNITRDAYRKTSRNYGASARARGRADCAAVHTPRLCATRLDVEGRPTRELHTQTHANTNKRTAQCKTT